MALPLAQQSMETSRELVSLGEWDVWLQGLVLLIAAAVLALTLWNYRRLQPPWRRFLLLGLRSGVVLLLVAVFYQPALVEEHRAQGHSVVPVLVDVSESMGLPHGEQSRLGLARRFLARHDALWERLRRDHELAFHTLGTGVREASDLAERDDEREGLRADDRGTRLVDGLRTVKRQHRNEDLGAVVLLTDGIDTTEAGRRDRLSPATRKLLEELDAPVVSFTIPRDDRLKDLAVEEVGYNDFAFVENATSMDATVTAHGYEQGSATVRLLENGQELSQKTISLGPDEHRHELSFEFVPHELGKQVYTIAIDHRSDEIYGGNNTQQMVVDVLRDQIRVLQIAGQPSWDERFLRNHFKEDPNVDLISFFILVSQMNVRPVRAAETALIPFPAQELFEQELGSFDVAIFQNFNYGPFQTRRYLPRIARYVREGGGFLMIGGDKSFRSGDYQGTAITDVLPVSLTPDPPGDDVNTERFEPELTEAGRRHPITRLALDPDDNAAAWKSLEPLYGVNVVTGTRDEALTLLEHPTLTDRDGEPLPVASIAEPGDGRSMAVMTDSTWRWSFVAGNRGGDPRHYDTFWDQALRWLVEDPQMALVRVRVAEEEVAADEGEVQARIEAYRPDYRPAADQPLEVTVRRRRPGAPTAEGEVVLRRDDARTNAEGRMSLTVPFDEPGVYEVRASAEIVEGRRENNDDLFVATEVNPELERVVGDRRLLEQLAGASGGSVQTLTGASPKVEAEPPRVTRVVGRRRNELWNAPWVLAALAALLGLEWWLRRRSGYL